APDFSGGAAYVAESQLWDRADPQSMVEGLTSEGPMPRDRTEWALLKHGRSSAAALRSELTSKDADTRSRAAQTLAWLGDGQSKPALIRLIQTDPERKDLYVWCLRKLGEVEQIQRGGA